MAGSIFELIIVLAASAVLTLVGIQQDIAKRRTQVMQAEGYNEAAIVGALATYITENQSAILATGATGNGGEALQAPNINALGLKNNYASGPFWGGAYTIALTSSPVGCSRTLGNCHVAYQFYPSKPYKQNGAVHIGDVAQIVGAANSKEAQFGYSNIAAKTFSSGVQSGPSFITGVGGTWSVANPLGSQPGTIMATNNGGTGDAGMLYIRRDGSLTWTGDQDVNNVSLRNVKDIKTQTMEASGAVSAASLAATGAVTAATVTATGAIKGNSIASTTTLQAGNIATPRVACSPNGIRANNADGSGQELTCQYGIWLPNGGRLLRMAYNPVYDGWTVGKPTCSAGGTPIVELTPQNWYVNTSATVNYNAYDQGTYWLVRVTDGSGVGVSGMAYAGSYCSY